MRASNPAGRFVLLASGLLLFTAAPASYASSSWLAQAAAEGSCPATPVNVPAADALSADALAKQIKVNGGVLQIEGTKDADHIVIRSAGPHAVHVRWNGKYLGRFGPIKEIEINGNEGDDAVILKPGVSIPAEIKGGAGDDCLQSGSGGDQLWGEAGDDVLIAGTGRPAINGGGGHDRIVIPQLMGTLRYAPAADSGVLRSLEKFYRLEPLRGHHCDERNATPIILGAADLEDREVLEEVKSVYKAGQSVAVTYSTEAEAEKLRKLLGHPNAAARDSSGGSKAEDTEALAFFRQGPRPHSKGNDYDTGYINLVSGNSGAVMTGELSRIFSATLAVPEPGGEQAANDLQSLAQAYNTHISQALPNNDAVQIYNSVYGVRSFLNNSDFYYVLQRITYDNEENALFVLNDARNIITSNPGPASGLVLVSSSPGSTQCSVSTTSGTDWNLGGSAGWNGNLGLGATLTGGVSISNSQTITCPQTEIANVSTTANAKTAWNFQTPLFLAGNNQEVINQWIWEVPTAAYQSGQTNMIFSSKASMEYNGGPALVASGDSSIPLPFGSTFTLETPVVTSVSPSCVPVGSTFYIKGTGFYPSLLTGLTIGGETVSPTLYSSISDKEIQVTAPDQPGLSGQLVQVQTGVGLSQQNVDIQIPYLYCDSGQ